MKTIIKIFLILCPLLSANATVQDTIYVMKGGAVLYKKAITDVDSISFENTLINRKPIVEKLQNERSYSIFYQALMVTGLSDSLLVDRDCSYNNILYSQYVFPKSDAWYYTDVPALRKYGFTLLMESDSVYNLNGINNLQDLKNYAASVYNATYPQDAGISDLKNRHNSLNRFVAYHIINKKLTLSKFIDAYDVDHMLKTIDMYDYMETLCPNTLIEVKKDRMTQQTNLFNSVTGTNSVITIIKSYSENENYNACIYGINNILSYSPAVKSYLSGKRLRFDFANCFPELSNNNIRGSGLTSPNLRYILPKGYISRIQTGESTSLGFLTPYDKIQNFQGDEFFITTTYGHVYDFSATTLPIPSGTYEVRLGYSSNGKRGVAAVYMDSIPALLPTNFNMRTNDSEIGYETPASNIKDINGFLNDKNMRNHGYMKGPACYKVPVIGWGFGENARYSEQILRIIIGTFTFNSDGSHVLTVKGSSEGEFQLDFIEFVPVSTLETEDIY